MIGDLVSSKAGRDEGRYYVIVAEDGKGYVYVADGEFKKFANPKRKNIKHLKFEEETLDIIKAKLIEKREVFDSEIKSALRRYNQKTVGGNRCQKKM